MYKDKLAIVRGGGDLATGVIYRLRKAHFSVLCLEIPQPMVVRRTVSVAEAVFSQSCYVEDIHAIRINSIDEWDNKEDVAVLVDPRGESIKSLRPSLVVDATMAKRYTGTSKELAPLVLALGPGFSAPDQVHGVIETKRGHYLGRLITNGSAIPNTGIPGAVMGYTTERVLRSPVDGVFCSVHNIGDHVEKGDIIATVNNTEVKAQISGILRGLLHSGIRVNTGVKIGDVDPRDDRDLCFTITDKALAVAGGVLDAVMRFL